MTRKARVSPDTSRCSVVALLLSAVSVLIIAQTATAQGVVFAFGNSESGQLGLGTTASANPTPSQIPGLTQVVQVAAGASHTLFLLANGDVYASGANNAGQLGTGDTVATSVPVLVPMPGPVRAVAAGWSHSLFVLQNGDAYSCGDNVSGQLGLGAEFVDQQPHPTPQRVLTGVASVAAGYAYSLFLLSTGDVYSCGRNLEAQCGFPGSTMYSDGEWWPYPKRIPWLSDVAAIAAGSAHSLFLTKSGDVYSSGANCRGQLGGGSYHNCYWGVTGAAGVHVQLPSSSRAEAVAAGYDYSLVLLEDGEVCSFGDFVDGKLGRPCGGAGEDAYYIPRRIPGLSGVVAIAAGSHSMFLLASGEVYACGPNTRGQLGIGTVDWPSWGHDPAIVPNLPSAGSVSVGSLNSFVIGQPSADWVEVTASTAVMYQSPAAGDGAKVKQVPQGWVLRNLGEVYVNPIPGSVMWKVKDETDETEGWVTNYLLGPAPNGGERAQLIVRGVGGVDGDPTIPASFMRDLDHNLDETSDDVEVKYLQYLLMAENPFTACTATAEGERIYPQSVGATGHFDVTTRDALKAFQTAHELDPSGILDAPTRTEFDNLIAGGRYDLTGTRAEVVIEEVLDVLTLGPIGHPPSWLSSDFLRGATTEQKISIILALIAHESGPEKHRFDNELVALTPWGRGLMQIDIPDACVDPDSATATGYVGWGSEITCYGEDGQNCDTCRDAYSHCKCYYTNTRQGIRANILDGLRALNEKWVTALSKCPGDDDEVMDPTRGIRRSELRWMLTVFLYNSRLSLEAAQVVFEVWQGTLTDQQILANHPHFPKAGDTTWLTKVRAKAVSASGTRRTFKECLTACEKATPQLVGEGNNPFYLREVGERMIGLGSLINYGTPGEDYADEVLGNRFVYVNTNAVIADLTGLGAKLRAAGAEPTLGVREAGTARTTDEMYDLGDGSAVVFFPSAVTEFGVEGTGDGTYDMRLLQLSGDSAAWFSARQMSSTPGGQDTYEVDWGALARGEEGVTVTRDDNGDGIPEETIHTGDLLIGEGSTAVLLESGWHMVSLPGTLCDPCTWTDGVVCGDLVCALGDDVDPFYAFRYDAVLRSYARVPPADQVCYQPGMGMWIYTWEPDTQIDSEVTALTGNVELALQNGWNQVGNPYTFSIGTGSIRVRCGAEELSLVDAQARGWITAMLFGYEAGAYVVIDPASGCLSAWTGCWLRAYRADCTLIFQPVGCTSSLTQARPLSTAEARALELPPPPPLNPQAVDIKEVLAGLSATNIPNPIRSEHTTVFRVEGVKADVVEEMRVDIYDLSGRLVFTQAIVAKELAWHTVNDAGELLANGVYLYQMRVKIGEIWYPLEIQKLAVVR